MKIIFLSSIITFIIYTSNSSAKDYCYLNFRYSNNEYINYPDTFVTFGNTINILIKTTKGDQCGGGCTFDPPTWYKNGKDAGIATKIGDTAYYVITDTGFYTTTQIATCGNGSEWFGPFSGAVHVEYRPATPIIEAINSNAFQIYPTISADIFYLKAKSQHQISKISIFNTSGRIIFTKTDNASEINLTEFANDIYFYAIEDDQKNIYRGKLIKQ